MTSRIVRRDSAEAPDGHALDLAGGDEAAHLCPDDLSRLVASSTVSSLRCLRLRPPGRRPIQLAVGAFHAAEALLIQIQLTPLMGTS